MQRTDGNIYGTTLSGGSALSTRIVFRLNTGLSPFVKLLPALGQVGSVVQIYGTNLAGTTAVSFNGVPCATADASFPDTGLGSGPGGRHYRSNPGDDSLGQPNQQRRLHGASLTGPSARTSAHTLANRGGVSSGLKGAGDHSAPFPCAIKQLFRDGLSSP